jgi:hypothetical protein
MSFDPDNLSAVVRYALESTRATALCPFHLDVSVRVGDDAAESHALARARNVIKSDGTRWKAETVGEEVDKQLGKAADGCCPLCAQTSAPTSMEPNPLLRVLSHPTFDH